MNPATMTQESSLEEEVERTMPFISRVILNNYSDINPEERDLKTTLYNKAADISNYLMEEGLAGHSGGHGLMYSIVPDVEMALRGDGVNGPTVRPLGKGDLLEGRELNVYDDDFVEVMQAYINQVSSNGVDRLDGAFLIAQDGTVVESGLRLLGDPDTVLEERLRGAGEYSRLLGFADKIGTSHLASMANSGYRQGATNIKISGETGRVRMFEGGRIVASPIVEEVVNNHPVSEFPGLAELYLNFSQPPTGCYRNGGYADLALLDGGEDVARLDALCA